MCFTWKMDMLNPMGGKKTLNSYPFIMEQIH